MREAVDVINDAIRENSKDKWFLYFLAFLFVIVGLGVIIHGVYSGNTSEKAIGIMASSLCYPSLHFARKIRQENITLRTLEIPLNNAKTAEGAAKMLQILMENVYLKKPA
ncbi:hypothetical protein [Teredinibacter turnerae]|uniref:hypothetical protein n=1 Tax=Teredinibacter turnerae TaxID=2426 RepID=UPI0003609DF5|nr:hypothetical protein [Teredinibacter turnerae]